MDHLLACMGGFRDQTPRHALRSLAESVIDRFPASPARIERGAIRSTVACGFGELQWVYFQPSRYVYFFRDLSRVKGKKPMKPI
jgi:hypothetical protein